ncbi:hypothetical protein HYX11_01820 [Candidatus Woesearchaeota archaeon]|nr:hypothetical protein [Candidatus Woesearchaeota archaeon]
MLIDDATMIPQLSGISERVAEPYRSYYGKPHVKMPILISGKDKKGNVVDLPREPVSFANVIERRLKAPKDVIEQWRMHNFFTGDGSIEGTEGDHLIVLDAQILRELTEKSRLFQGAYLLPNEAWQELKGQKENVLYLTAEEKWELYNDRYYLGYVRNRGVWIPASRTVGKVWDTLSRGRNLSSYLQLVSEYFSQSDNLLRIQLNTNRGQTNQPIMQSLVAEKIDYGSYAYCYNNFDSENILLVGLLRRMKSDVTYEKGLEERVKVVRNLG